MYDCHVHTERSPDSTQPLDEICETAIARGLTGIAVTDHAEIWHLEDQDVFRQTAASAADARAAAVRYGDRLRVSTGVEIAEAQDDPETAAKILALADFDVVLGSCHSVAYLDWPPTRFYDRVPFDALSDELLTGFLDLYFQRILHIAEEDDIDVLAHLTCPLRYIVGRYHRTVDLRRWSEIVDAVLRALIRREKALEVNASGIGNYYGDWMPHREILERYYALGGRLVTLASDAHTASRVGNAFPETAEMLRDIGFDGAVWYERRTPHLCPWGAA